MSMMGYFLETTPELMTLLKMTPGLVGVVVNLTTSQPQLPFSEKEIEKLPAEVRENLMQSLKEMDKLTDQMNEEQIAKLKKLAPKDHPYILAQLKGRQAFSVDKDWHGIHFVLTGNTPEQKGALGQAVFGGKALGDDLGYGPARLLSPEEVKKVSNALQSFTDAQFKKGYTQKKMNKQEIYPGGWEMDENYQIALTHFNELKAYYKGAADKNQAMLLFVL